MQYEEQARVENQEMLFLTNLFLPQARVLWPRRVEQRLEEQLWNEGETREDCLIFSLRWELVKIMTCQKKTKVAVGDSLAQTR